MRGTKGHESPGWISPEGVLDCQAIEFLFEDSCVSLRLGFNLLLGSHEILIGFLRVSVLVLVMRKSGERRNE
jgi:hypothetical protein